MAGKVTMPEIPPKLDAIMRKLTPSERDLLRANLFDTSFPGEQLAYRLEAMGHPVSPTTIKTYRRRVAAYLEVQS